ncbi:MAG TPA: hypothetical protein VGP93_16510 [Polyangiaceae bacterium]|jgi:hypothetical protein|nr:hypothetical protein [Polyangiaceae bacterium]
MSAHAFGAGLAFQRLRTRMLGVLLALSGALVVIVSLLERASDRDLATDRALSGVVFGLCLPLLCYATFEIAAARADLNAAIQPFARHGLARPSLALGLITSIALQNALSGAVLSALAVLLTRAGHPHLFADLGAVVWIGALTGASYTGLLALGSVFRRGRLWLLIADWLLGSGSGLLALPWPRAHARNLLGLPPVLGFSQPTAVALLLLIAAGGTLLASQRLPR